jgi:hypothetical protein
MELQVAQILLHWLANKLLLCFSSPWLLGMEDRGLESFNNFLALAFSITICISLCAWENSCNATTRDVLNKGLLHTKKFAKRLS